MTQCVKMNIIRNYLKTQQFIRQVLTQHWKSLNILKSNAPPSFNELIVRYHRNIENELGREEIVSDFVLENSIIKVLVTTIALGCGIDKPNIDVIICWGMPNFIEAIQIFGKASRRGINLV